MNPLREFWEDTTLGGRALKILVLVFAVGTAWLSVLNILTTIK